MDLGLKGKVAVVCGGTTGIGAEAALRFLEEGCELAVCSHNVEKVEAFKERVKEAGYENVLIEIVDVTSSAELEAFADKVEEKFGRIDIWVNCAGGNRWAPIYDLPEENFDWIVNLNLKTVFLGIKTATNRMKKHGSGSIVSISSLSSKVPVAYRGTYGAAKAGVNLLTIAAAAENAPFGIRVNAVSPGITDTVLSKKAIHTDTDYTMSMIPMKRAGRPDELGDVIVMVASDRCSYMTGSIIDVNGGKDLVEDTDLPYTQPWGK